MLLTGKSIIVTGGNSGIVKAIVLAAAAEGANVVIDYRMHPEYTAEVAAAAGRAGGRAIGVEADVSRTEDLHRVIQAAVENFGWLDVLVSNAGLETRTSLLGTSEAEEGRSDDDCRPRTGAEGLRAADAGAWLGRAHDPACHLDADPGDPRERPEAPWRRP